MEDPLSKSSQFSPTVRGVLSMAVGMLEMEILEWVTKVPAAESNRRAKSRADDLTTMQDRFAAEL